MAAHETTGISRALRAGHLHGIYLIVNDDASDPLAIARAGLAAGIEIVQYRAKRGLDAQRLNALRALTAERKALLILNDEPAAAVAFDCDGVHLGPDDEGFRDVAGVRAMLGDRLIGLSCGTVPEAEAAARGGADYIGVGSVFATGSKSDAGDPIGIEGLQQVARAGALPVAAIGGIDDTNLTAVARTGVAMAAVISAVANDPDPASAALRLVRIWNGAVS